MEKRGLLSIVILCLALASHLNQQVAACRVSSDKLKAYATKTIERLLDADKLKSFYWPAEPLNAKSLSKASGLNITLAETRFNLFDKPNPGNVGGRNESRPEQLLRDIIFTCASDRDLSYTLTMNLELTNPFKAIDLYYQQSAAADTNDKTNELPAVGLIQVLLPQSCLLVQLSQRISYDECLDINYVQLAPNVNYEVQCEHCKVEQKKWISNIFQKRMTQFDSELDPMLSEKLQMALHALLSQQRLDLDLYLD